MQVMSTSRFFCEMAATDGIRAREKNYIKGEELYKRSAYVLIPFVLYTELYVCMLQFTE